jgi:WD40 repeat protein
MLMRRGREDHRDGYGRCRRRNHGAHPPPPPPPHSRLLRPSRSQRCSLSHTHRLPQGDTAPVTAMAWHPSGEQLAVSTRSLQTRFWAMPDPDEPQEAAPEDPDDPDAYTGPRCEELHTFKAHDMPVMTMSFDTSGALLATGDSMGNVRVWDAMRKYCTHNFSAHRGVVHALAFHPDKSRYQLFSAGQDSRVQVYDLRKKEHVHTFDRHQGAVRAYRFPQFTAKCALCVNLLSVLRRCRPWPSPPAGATSLPAAATKSRLSGKCRRSSDESRSARF